MSQIATPITMPTPQQALGIDNSHITFLTETIGIHNQSKDDWLSMCAAAKQDGLDIAIASGFRSFERQLLIWQLKIRGERAVYNLEGSPINTEGLEPAELITAIMLFSALPGASRHHWGTDIDVYAPNLLPDGYQLQLTASEYAEKGPLHSLHQWLKRYASDFNFYFPYENYTGGVAAEPWHLSHHPVAKQYEKILTIDLLYQHLNDSDITHKEILLSNLPMLYNRFIKLS